MRGLIVMSMAVTGALSGAVLAADADAPAGPARGSETSEFVIQKDPPTDPAELRKALTQAEDRFYARYNELNKDDEYDIICRAVVQTGKRLAERSCEPRFVDDVKRDSSSANLSSSRAVGGGSAPMSTSSYTKVNEKYEEFRKRMQSLASEDPALQGALAERNRLDQAYRALQKK